MEKLTYPVLNLGQITNVVDFGAFVDIGVGKNGLLHRKAMYARNEALSVGCRVNVKIQSLDIDRGRIGLELDG